MPSTFIVDGQPVSETAFKAKHAAIRWNENFTEGETADGFTQIHEGAAPDGVRYWYTLTADSAGATHTIARRQ